MDGYREHSVGESYVPSPFLNLLWSCYANITVFSRYEFIKMHFISISEYRWYRGIQAFSSLIVG